MRGHVTFLEQDALEQRILVAEHQAFIGGRTVALLEVLKGLFMVLYGSFELFDVLGASFAECRLRLAISLFPFF